MRGARTRRRVVSVLLAAGVVVAGLTATAPARAAIDCSVPNPPPACGDPGGGAAPPTGTLTSVLRRPAGLLVSGTAADPDGGTDPVVTISVDGVQTGSAITSSGGVWSGVVPARAGSTVCARATVPATGATARIGCLPYVVPFDPVGALEYAWTESGGVVLTGWALDPDSAGPVPVSLTRDGVTVLTQPAGDSRPEVDRAYPGYGDGRGFRLGVPTDGAVHTWCVVAGNVAPGTRAVTLGCRSFAQAYPPAPPVLTVVPDVTLPVMHMAVVVVPGTKNVWMLKQSPTGTWPKILSVSVPATPPVLLDDLKAPRGTTACYKAVGPINVESMPVCATSGP